MTEPGKPRITITYCRQCQWLLRAAWMAQELLSPFGPELADGRRIEYEGELVWDRKSEGGFPDVKTLKQLVRDRLDPGRDLGHVDRP